MYIVLYTVIYICVIKNSIKNIHSLILEYHLSKKNLLEEYITFTLQTEKIFGKRK